MPDSKHRILYLFPGPKYDLEHDFKVRLEALSVYCSGTLLVTGEDNEIRQYGDFMLKCLPITKQKKLLIIKYFFTALSIAVGMKRRGGLDLVVTYDPLRTGLMGLIISRLLRVKLATEVNGDFTAWENYRDVSNKRLRALKRKIYMSVEKFVLTKTDGFKLLYPTQVDFCNQAVANKVVHVFPAYIDLSPFKNLGEEKYILFAGFPFHVKGLDRLIPAFKSIAEEFSDWRLMIIGWFPDTSELDEYIDGHEQISYHPPVIHKEMPHYIGRCGFLVLPSRTETMGRVLLEAMSAGKPRLASNVGGIPLTIEHGVDGLLFDSEDDSQLAEYMKLLMSDEALRRKMSEACLKRVQKEFTLENYFCKMNEYYTDVLSS